MNKSEKNSTLNFIRSPTKQQSPNGFESFSSQKNPEIVFSYDGKRSHSPQIIISI